MVSTQVHRGQPRLHNVPKPTNHLHRLEDVRKYTTTLQASKQNKIRSDFVFSLLFCSFDGYCPCSFMVNIQISWKNFMDKETEEQEKSTMRTYYDRDSANLLNSCLVIMAMMLPLSLSSKCKQSKQFEGIVRMNCLETFNTYCICIRLY